MKLTHKIMLLTLFLLMFTLSGFAQERGADEIVVGWSPDGTQLAITSNRTGQEELYVIDTNGTVINHLFEGRSIWAARWSSGGQLAVLLANPDDETVNELHLVTPSTGETKFLTNIPISFGWAITWSPDSQYIALTSDTSISVVNVTDASVQTVGDAFYYPRFEWSPNSQYIAVVSQEGGTQSENVFFYNVVTQTRSSNLLATYWKREPACCLSLVAWSPDSTRLAIAVMNDANLYISNIASETLVPVAHTGGPIEELTWSANGTEIIYHVGWRTQDVNMIPQEQLEGGRAEGIYRVTIADGAITPIMQYLGQAFSTSFSPNRAEIVFRTMDSMGSREFLNIGTLADGSIRSLQMDFFKALGWFWSPNGTHAAVSLCDSSEGDADVYLVEIATGSAVNINPDDAFTGEAQPSTCPGMG